MQSVHQLFQPHTISPHPTPAWWPWDNLTHGHWRKLPENEARIVSPRTNCMIIWENWGRCRLCWSCNYPNPRGASGQYCILTDPHKWGNGKSLWSVGINYGWPKYLSGLKEPLHASIQVISYPQEIHSRWLWIWHCSKPCAGNRLPNCDGGCTVIPRKCNNWRQGGNEKTQNNQLDALT